MKIKNAFLMVLSFVLVAALSIGGTVAYLTATDSEVNVMTTGNVKITQQEYQYDYEANQFEAFEDNKLALPAVYQNGERTAPVGAEGKVKLINKEWGYWSNTENANIIDKYITVKNNGSVDIYFRTILAVEVGGINMNLKDAGTGMTRYLRTMSNYDDTTDLSSADYDYVRTYLTDDTGNIVTAEINGQTYMFIIFTYKNKLAANTESEPSLRQICLGHGLNSTQVESLGSTWEVIALSQAVQASGFNSADVALKAGFGEVTAANVAKWFKNIAPTNAAN